MDIAGNVLFRFSQGAVKYLLSGLQRGYLRIEDLSTLDESGAVGQSFEFGTMEKGGVEAVVVVKRSAFWSKVFLMHDIGFAEAYMAGDVECSDLVSLFRIFIQNEKALTSNSYCSPRTLFTPLVKVFRGINDLSHSESNVVAHYDLSNEIGTGWGSFAILAVQVTGCRVTTITLSKEQKRFAQERIEIAGLTDRITVVLKDYRRVKIPEGGKKFDKIVSIEMLEAVGEEYLETYFQCVNDLLKQGGIATFQCITMPEERHAKYRKYNNDFCAQNIFPGGYLPSNTQLFESIIKGSKGRLTVESVENIGGHYCRALRLWREAFLANFEERIKPAIIAKYEASGRAETAEQMALIFKKKWEYYFTYCEAGFREKILNDIIITVARIGCMELYDGMPL